MKPYEEWFKQSDYDLETAKAMFQAGRYIYVVFMCHLALEKALKGVFTMKLKKIAPKTHNLIYFCEKAQIKLPLKTKNFLDNLNSLSVPTRYPDKLENLLKEYKKDRVETILSQTKEALLCLKQII